MLVKGATGVIHTVKIYFWSQVNIWNVSCARATTFIFDTRTDVLVKVSKFLRQKCLDLRGNRTSIFGLMPNGLNISSIRTRHLLSRVFEYWLWRYRYFWSKVDIWNINCMGNSIHFRHTNGCYCESVKSFWDSKYLDLMGTRSRCQNKITMNT